MFGIAYAVDILLGNEPSTIKYDQSKMREHLVTCFEGDKLSSFPKHRSEENQQKYDEQIVSQDVKMSDSDWKYPVRRSQRIKQKKTIGNSVK